MVSLAASWSQCAWPMSRTLISVNREGRRRYRFATTQRTASRPRRALCASMVFPLGVPRIECSRPLSLATTLAFAPYCHRQSQFSVGRRGQALGAATAKCPTAPEAAGRQMLGAPGQREPRPATPVAQRRASASGGSGGTADSRTRTGKLTHCWRPRAARDFETHAAPRSPDGSHLACCFAHRAHPRRRRQLSIEEQRGAAETRMVGPPPRHTT